VGQEFGDRVLGLVHGILTYHLGLGFIGIVPIPEAIHLWDPWTFFWTFLHADLHDAKTEHIPIQLKARHLLNLN